MKRTSYVEKLRIQIKLYYYLLLYCNRNGSRCVGYTIIRPPCLVKTLEHLANVDGSHYVFKDVAFKLVAVVSGGITAVTTPVYPPPGYTPPTGESVLPGLDIRITCSISYDVVVITLE